MRYKGDGRSKILLIHGTDKDFMPINEKVSPVTKLIEITTYGEEFLKYLEEK